MEPFDVRSVVIWLLSEEATPDEPLKSWLTALKSAVSAAESLALLMLSVPSLLVVMPTLARELYVGEPVLTTLYRVERI
jgi:hypothetical protein